MRPPHLYYRDGIALGVDPDVLERAADERARLRAQGAYPLLSLAHLAHETGASYTYLREVVSRTRDPYQDVAIPKADGGTRPISAPEPILMDVQRWILKHLLERTPTHPASFAYRPGTSIVHCAEQHAGASWMVKMDLHDFFGTVTETSVYRVFRRLGYAKLVSFELARITTRAQNARYAPWLAGNRTIRAYSVDAEGVLPQGGPSSGQLANAAATRLDRLIQSFALEAGLTYTRYSDDLMFSSHAAFRRVDAVNVIRRVSGLTRAAGFSPHRNKSRIVPPGARRVVLGLLVDDSVRLLPEHRRRIEVHIRACEKFGLAEHAAHRGFDSVFSFVDHLDGWISFALGVERDRAMVWRSRFNHVLSGAGLLSAIQRV
ncbi:reverse transcriptase family protein [Agromyces mariniharenae]|uniref:RNA-directed DNA polymerase n=1 Tax=Agromyces mariniharenae TaxID=2604423 RepID=A0A5S4V530_9MICO|nr:reverse transcriptase family protein [Agromyces mariniharenae]TYL54034.1 RNA-directed DNA polymerase [Agromyces mariniharenae]